MQNTTTSHCSGDGDYEWALQNMLLDQNECLAEEEEEDYVDYANDDSINGGGATAISCSTAAASTWAAWTCSTNESGGTGRGLSIPNPVAAIKARGGIRRRPRTNRASSIKTTVVKANPTNFRALVQQFTGCHSQFPHPPLPLKGKGPINLNFAQYTITTPTPTPTPTSTPITYLSRNIPTSSHPPHGLQQQQGCLATANNNNNDINDATILAAAASASEHPQSPPPPFTSFSSDHDEMELIARELSTVWETHDQYHYAKWNNR